jgi:exodeoxyribonuclease V alpha subunit
MDRHQRHPRRRADCHQQTGRADAAGRDARTQVELAYASTVHGGQGETVETAHFALGEHTAAASAYVALTRGREANTVHIVAENIEQARDVWAETFSRDRADLGPAVAAQRVASDADLCASQRPLADALTDLRTAWTVEDTRRRELLRATSERDRLRQFVTAKADYDAAIIPLDIERQRAAQAAQRATSYADQLTDVVEATAGRYADRLQQQRDELRADVRETARTVLDGPGRFGLHHRRVENATAELTQWANNWRPVVPDLPTDPDRLARTAAGYDSHRVREAIGAYGRAAAEHEHPQYRTAVQKALTAAEHARRTETAYYETVEAYDRRLINDFGTFTIYRDPVSLLDRLDGWVVEARSSHDAAVGHVHDLMAEPALRSLPTDRLQAQRDTWRHDRDAQIRAEQAASQRAALGLDNPTRPTHVHQPAPSFTMQPPQHGHGIGI